MKFVLFGGFLLVSSAVILAAAVVAGGSSGIAYLAMGIGLLISIFGLVKKDN